MRSRLKNRRQIRSVVLFTTGFVAVSCLFVAVLGTGWFPYDYKMLDVFYRLSVGRGFGPKASFTPQIVYLLLTDKTYDAFDQNYLDREKMACVNTAVSALAPEAVAYDILFIRKSTSEADARFADSLARTQGLFMPVCFSLRDDPVEFAWKQDAAHRRLRQAYVEHPVEKGVSCPYYAGTALLQSDAFFEAADCSGDISVPADSDGVYRHVPLLIRIDDGYVPTLSFAMFLNWAKISMKDVVVEWGDRVVVQASKKSRLDTDVVIPINERGQVYVPLVDRMGEDFREISVHRFMACYQDDAFRGNLAEIFEGNFVFVADVSTGASDMGKTPLQKNAHLVSLHANMLNALLTSTFYRKWSLFAVMGLVMLICFLPAAVSLQMSSWPFYLTGCMIFVGLAWVVWLEFTRFFLVPVATVGSIGLLHFIGLTGLLEVVASGEKKAIRNLFSRYVPEEVVAQLLADPAAVELGGEERVLTVLFSDLVGFTTISEKMPPRQLVSLLNEYLSEMTQIVFREGGIIDKYQGDSIMAEFGIPLPAADHADRAVAAALAMQQRLSELRMDWQARGLPELHCRVGINTGSMVVGNMGADRARDYTVIGDAVNLASRLEGANKNYGTQVMISHKTYACLTPERFLARLLDVVQVKGKSEQVKVYEVYGRQGDTFSRERTLYYRRYQEAVDAYIAGDHAAALKAIRQALALQPEDLPATQMLKRMENHGQTAMARMHS